MRRIAPALMAAALSAVAASPVLAVQAPIPSPHDARMRYVAYSPDQVVHLSTGVGVTLVVAFGPKETITAVAVANSKDLAAMPRGNFLFFKSKQALPLQPVVVLTSSEAGNRRYVFDIVTTAMTDYGPDAPDLYYSVQFLYPQDEAVARRAEAQARAEKAQAAARERDATAELRRVHQDLEHGGAESIGTRATGGPQGSGLAGGGSNWRYVAQGDRSILPLEVSDDGYSTVFRFPGNVRLPAIFVINPDGQEATPNYAVKGDRVQVEAVARGWRLRDGQTVLSIWNKSFDPVGRNPGTQTTSPNVQRVVKEAPR